MYVSALFGDLHLCMCVCLITRTQRAYIQSRYTRTLYIQSRFTYMYTFTVYPTLIHTYTHAHYISNLDTHIYTYIHVHSTYIQSRYTYRDYISNLGSHMDICVPRLDIHERWGAGVEYHFQEFNEPYAPS